MEIQKDTKIQCSKCNNETEANKVKIKRFIGKFNDVEEQFTFTCKICPYCNNQEVIAIDNGLTSQLYYKLIHEHVNLMNEYKKKGKISSKHKIDNAKLKLKLQVLRTTLYKNHNNQEYQYTDDAGLIHTGICTLN